MVQRFNAARGIAQQVNGIISNFAGNFIMALNPQITKQYASGKTEQSVKLVYTGSRGSKKIFQGKGIYYSDTEERKACRSSKSRNAD